MQDDQHRERGKSAACRQAKRGWSETDWSITIRPQHRRAFFNPRGEQASPLNAQIENIVLPGLRRAGIFADVVCAGKCRRSLDAVTLRCRSEAEASKGDGNVPVGHPSRLARARISG
ncbi:hypothetical protein HNQ36_002036 [Afipia massiliensis]|uniref:Uncharacterized protein n=1 Tax=Afipia massiliensis TaxID=211460 RepID=A0A840MZA7_9BRAD|nr:hypothetical protein [Afipia massiliensis]MBB5052062.1 hypothetical protein [Afipia massiliensis]